MSQVKQIGLNRFSSIIQFILVYNFNIENYLVKGILAVNKYLTVLQIVVYFVTSVH